MRPSAPPRAAAMPLLRKMWLVWKSKNPIERSAPTLATASENGSLPRKMAKIAAEKTTQKPMARVAFR